MAKLIDGDDYNLLLVPDRQAFVDGYDGGRSAGGYLGRYLPR
jgi:hypothetical protein